MVDYQREKTRKRDGRMARIPDADLCSITTEYVLRTEYSGLWTPSSVQSMALSGCTRKEIGRFSRCQLGIGKNNGRMSRSVGWAELADYIP